MRTDFYQHVTDSIVAQLERGVRPWIKPWNAEHAAGRITRRLRGNLVPYQGINVLMLWLEAVEKGFAAQVWMTFKQALELNAHVNETRSLLIQTPHIALELLPEPLNHLIELATISKEQSLTRLYQIAILRFDRSPGSF